MKISVLLFSVLFSLNLFASLWVKGASVSAGGYREYKLFVPTSYYDVRNTLRFYPLVVMFHGCTQDGDSFSEGTRMNELAEKEGFIVLYPEQTYAVNKYACWNWFFKFNQTPLYGEPSIAHVMIETVRASFRVDRQKTYAVGFSAGGAMANIMASCFPWTFKAVAIYSGLEFKAADNSEDAFAATTDGGLLLPEESGEKAYKCALISGRKPISAIIIHDHEAKRMATVHAEQVEKQFITMNDLYDNKKLDGSVAPKRIFDERIHNDPTKYPFDLYTHSLTNGAVIKRYMIYDLDHAWSGGNDALPFNDPKGPDATKMIWNFFKEVSVK